MCVCVFVRIYAFLPHVPFCIDVCSIYNIYISIYGQPASAASKLLTSVSHYRDKEDRSVKVNSKTDRLKCTGHTR